MKRMVAGLAGLLMLFASAGYLYAGYDQVFGTLKSVDADGGQIVLSVRSGRGDEATTQDTTFLIDKETSVKIDNEKKMIADLKEGVLVNLFFREAAQPDGKATALLIVVRQMRRGGQGGGGQGGN